MKHLQTAPSARHQQGATLVEVLVSILLMSVGLVAMAAMQVNALQYSKTSETRSLATLLANDLADRMRANHPDKQSLAAYNATAAYTAPSSLPAEATTSCTGTAASCDFSQMAAYDLASWKRDLFRQLPQGTGYVRTINDQQVDIWVVWTDPSSDSGQQVDACPNSYGAPAGVRCMYFRVAL